MPGTYRTLLIINGLTKAITIRAQNAVERPILLLGANIFNSNNITIQDIYFKRTVNVRNCTKINILRNFIEVADYSPLPGKA
jgi:hypothetical protein